MIVRDPGLPLERSVLLLWERRGAPAAQESDAMAEVMAVVCQELLRQGVGCRAAWNGGGELTVQEVREPEGFYELLPRRQPGTASRWWSCTGGCTARSRARR